VRVFALGAPCELRAFYLGALCELRAFILHCDVHRLLYTVMYPLCICVAPPFGFLIYTFYLSKKKKLAAKKKMIL
jgi:hypothetical protein